MASDSSDWLEQRGFHDCNVTYAKNSRNLRQPSLYNRVFQCIIECIMYMRAGSVAVVAGSPVAHGKSERD
jgi:hypothetical protein